MKKRTVCMQGYSLHGMSKLALGTHLGDFSEEDSKRYEEAISFALQNGIPTIDGAINYRGMCSEKDEGNAIQRLMEQGKLKREDFCITSKAGLLFGDVQAGLNPQRMLEEVLEPQGILKKDFTEYEGLWHTMHPKFYELALEKTLENLGLETLDVHYIHIPEISRTGSTEDGFYEQLEVLFRWYEKKVSEGKIRAYGLALEFMVEEPFEEKWHFELEKCKEIADRVASGQSHFRYVLFEYNLLCDHAGTKRMQRVAGKGMTMMEACKALGLETVGSMPFAMGDGLEQHSVEQLLTFAIQGVDHVIVGSKNVAHLQEILGYL